MEIKAAERARLDKLWDEQNADALREMEEDDLFNQKLDEINGQNGFKSHRKRYGRISKVFF